MEQKAILVSNYEYRRGKRLFDFISALIGIVVLSPIFLIVALLVKLDSPKEKVLFIQIRTGFKNKSFRIFKFRSMRKSDQPGGARKHVYEWANGVPDDFVFKSASGNDPDVSAIGAFVRKFSLDELPQLFNVLRGDMSIVGPRPEIPAITQFYSKTQQTRLLVKPGVTGWAQVNGRSNMNHGQKIAYDTEYVQNSGWKLDARVIVMTVKQVLTGKDAF
ncbi:sugar transferase [Listeria booriae]|uniref:Sugar transferase n=1 Tax=Listeria booriae TaxID=1552123 RepID=A0A7X1CMD5_9LIST|nr:sugar transferase [Listeria booriae]MBC1794186.1 sugar transferase [Listeria booriae]MBC1795780.1 sugar transferase [Listeria booriae]MBC1800095.1 sugar transferase [Listeria booriae]MBC1804505.1 sugar transferase [Listeria booriae]MBC1813599.1 sugar transferase [Listeria booriae]